MPLFSASAWNSVAPFTTLIYRSSTILFISRHQNISTRTTCSALGRFDAAFWCRFFRLQHGIVRHHFMHVWYHFINQWAPEYFNPHNLFRFDAAFLVPFFFWLQHGIVRHHSLHSYTGPVPYLSVGTRIFQPAQPVPF